MKIANVMSRDVHFIGPDTTFREAARQMKKIDSGCLPVAERDKLVGMLTDRDIAIRAVAEGKGPDARVRDAMTEESNTAMKTKTSRMSPRIWATCSCVACR